MSKRLMLLLCAVLALALATPAFAAVQNVKVSGDILARYIQRDNFDLTKGSGAAGEDRIGVFNTVTRLRVDADLTDNVQTTIRLINERDWEQADTTTTDIDLDLAYVTLKEFLYSPLTVTVGRQELHFGNDMIMGDGVGKPNTDAVSGGIGTNQTTNYTEGAGWEDRNGDLSLRKSFDAIRATLNYDPLVVDIVYAKIDNGSITSAEGDNDDIDLWGANAGYQFKDKWNTMVEGYFWTKHNGGLAKTSTVDKADVVNTVGARVSTMPTSKINLQQELAYQFGHKISPAATGTLDRKRDAWAAQSVAMYTPGWKLDPTFGLIYSYFSGDANRDSAGTVSADKKFHAWDPMFENQTTGSILNALFPQSNCNSFDFMGKFSPIEDVVLQADYVYVLLGKTASTTGYVTDFNDYDGTGYSFYAGKNELGQELDVNLTYNYTEDVQLGLLCGWFWPGSALNKTGANNAFRTTAAEAIASCKVSF